MTPTPVASRRADNARFGAWVVGGAALIALNWVLADYFTRVYPAAAASRDVLAAVVRQAPWVSLGYALGGMCWFCDRGCLVLVCGAAFVCCPFLSWFAAALGTL